MYVEDCAQANVCAMKADITNQFYNVGTGKRTSIKELSEIVLGLTNSNLSIEYEPAGLTFVKNRIGCTKKAERDINFKAKIDLTAGLQELISWRKQHVEELEERRKKAN